MTGEREAPGEVRFRGDFPDGTHLLLAVSGGPDSLAMAALFREWAPLRGWVVSWAHADHGLRGGESDADAAFVARLAEAWNIPCRVARIGVPRSGSLEAAARQARYVFLARAAVAAGAGFVLTAHTRDDQAETVLMRLARGSGVRGLRGILSSRPVLPGSRIRLVRPFLGESREALRAILAAREIPFRVDSSNKDFRFARNRVRAFLASLAPGRPDLLDRLSRAAEASSSLWERVEGVLAPGLAAVWRDAEDVAWIDASALSALPDPIAREILREGIRCRGGASLSRAHLERLHRFFREGRSGRSLDLPGGIWRREYDRVVWIRSAVASPGDVPVPGAGRYAWGDWRFSVTRGDGSGGFAVRDSLFPLAIRRWRPGDRIRAAGASVGRNRKMSDFWGDRKIPRSVRDAWPLVCKGGTVIVVPGLAVHVEAAPSPGEKAFLVTAARAGEATCRAHDGAHNARSGRAPASIPAPTA